MSKRLNVFFNLKTLELDFRGRIPLALLCRYMQDAAENHAVALDVGVEDLLKQKMTWMLLKFQMKIDRYPEGRQRIRVETWPSGAESRYALRDFRFFEDDEDNPFAEATSRWSVIDIEKLRPIRIEEQMLSVGCIDPTRVKLNHLDPVRSNGKEEKIKEFNVRLSDLDLNQHVNNLHFIEWLIESVPDNIWQTYELSEMEIEFRKEVHFGERVFSYIYKEDVVTDDLVYLHFLRTGESETDIVRARIHRRSI